MKTHNLIKAEIKSLSHDGRGITDIEGKTTFVDGALPDEVVELHIRKKHSRYYEAEAINILQSSDERTSPPCQYFGVCGGCSLQHMKMTAQITLKQNTLLEQLKHFGNVIPENILTPISGEPLHYRRKARLGVKYVKKKNRVLVGFREKASHYLADIDECLVLHPSVGKKIKLLAELIQGLVAFDKIPQIEVAISDKENALVFRHMIDLPTNDIEKIIAFARLNQFSIYLQPNPPKLISKLWPEEGDNLLRYSLEEYNLSLEFSPLDFVQVNAEINLRMLKQALQLLDLSANDIVLDLFCGVGNFTLPIARFAHQVIGVEGNQEMVERAKKNAKLNNLNNLDFYVDNLFNPTNSSWRNIQYDKILLDPPRTGAKELLDNYHMNTKRIVYVSCNPATLARDAGILVYNHNYKLRTVGVINMFPHTSHIEAIALFEKA